MTCENYTCNNANAVEREQERLNLLERAKNLEEIERQIDDRFKEADEIRAYNEKIDRYCQENGLSYYQYEKICYWAERGVGDFPEPERSNPDREITHEYTVER